MKFYLVLNSQYYYKDLFNFNKSSYFNLILCFSQNIFEEYVVLFLIYLLIESSSKIFNWTWYKWDSANPIYFNVSCARLQKEYSIQPVCIKKDSAFIIRLTIILKGTIWCHILERKKRYLCINNKKIPVVKNLQFKNN